MSDQYNNLRDAPSRDRAARCAPHAVGTPEAVPLAERRFKPPPVLYPAVGSLAELPPDWQWDVAHCLSSHEKALAWKCYDAGVAYLLPLETRRARNGDRFRTRHEPLIGGYVFLASADWQRTRERLWQTEARRHLISFIRVTDQAQLVRDLTPLHYAITSGHRFGSDFARPGRRCVVRGGPFDGHEGEIDHAGERGRIFLNITFLGQRVSFECDIASLDPV